LYYTYNIIPVLYYRAISLDLALLFIHLSLNVITLIATFVIASHFLVLVAPVSSVAIRVRQVLHQSIHPSIHATIMAELKPTVFTSSLSHEPRIYLEAWLEEAETAAVNLCSTTPPAPLPWSLPTPSANSSLRTSPTSPRSWPARTQPTLKIYAFNAQCDIGDWLRRQPKNRGFGNLHPSNIPPPPSHRSLSCSHCLPSHHSPPPLAGLPEIVGPILTKNCLSPATS
jgi:hypothetical protein